MQSIPRTFRVGRFATGVLVAFQLSISVLAAAQETGQSAKSAAEHAQPAGLYLEVRLPKPMKAAALKPGDSVEGKLSRDVYSEASEVFPAGSAIRLTVGGLEKRKAERDDHWPGVVGLFAPRHRSFPIFRSAVVSLPTGDVPLRVSLISVTRPVEVVPQSKSKASSAPPAPTSVPQEGGAYPSAGAVRQSPAGMPASTRRAPVQTLTLEATAPEPLPALGPQDISGSASASGVTVAAGTRAQIVLLAPLSASKNHPGDPFRARLLEPVRSGSRVLLPAGSLFSGTVKKSTRPRWLSRPGSLYLSFTEIELTGGIHTPVTAQLVGAEMDRRSGLRMDTEGQLSGGHPGKAWMLINLGVAGGLAKEADDGFQLVVEALVSTATDASTAGTARIVAACASGFFMVTRHGRDVVLPRFTELEVTFNRPLTLGEVALDHDASSFDENSLEYGLRE